jgi:hypothetical protein
MVEQKFMPPSLHESPYRTWRSVMESILSLQAPAGKSSAWLFPKLPALFTSPGEVLSSYRFLGKRLDGGVGSCWLLRSSAYWGREDLLESHRGHPS